MSFLSALQPVREDVWDLDFSDSRQFMIEQFNNANHFWSLSTEAKEQSDAFADLTTFLENLYREEKTFERKANEVSEDILEWLGPQEPTPARTYTIYGRRGIGGLLQQTSSHERLPHRAPEVVQSQLPLLLLGQKMSAVVDTGAQENVMTKKLAKKLNLTVHQPGETPHTFVNAIGEVMKAVGYAELKCSFQQEPSQRSYTRFWIFPKLAVPLLVGRQFLEQTKALTKFAHCLRKIIPSKVRNWRVLHMELPRWRLSCRVGDSVVLANPDTGSDLDLISLSYARESGFQVHNLRPNHPDVQFPNGTQKRLSGVVSVPFGIGVDGKEQVLRNFYVLDGLTSDVLLGNHTLNEFDAFNFHKNEFVDLESYDSLCDLHFIRWVQRKEESQFLDTPFSENDFVPLSYDNKAHFHQAPKMSIVSRWRMRRERQKNGLIKDLVTRAESDARYDQYLQYQDIKEQRRRKKAMDDISKLSIDQKIQAETAEANVQKRYDQEREDFRARYRAAVSVVSSESASLTPASSGEESPS